MPPRHMRTTHLRLTSRTLGRIAVMNGYRDVGHLARQLGRNRVTLYNALRFPSVYGPTLEALEAALPIREARN